MAVPRLDWAAVALGITLMVHTVGAKEYGPVASEVLAACPRNSFYGEDFWMGVNILEAAQVAGAGECCSKCDDNQACTRWTFCPASEADGCQVQVGPLAGRRFAGGTCLLSNGRASDNSTFLSWSYMQPGQLWSSGSWTPEDLEVQVFEDASSYQDDMEGIESRQDAFFCRKVVDGAAEFRPAGGTPPGAAPPLATAGLEVAYTGLRLADSEGVQWALLYFNDSKSFWLAPFDSLGHCDSEQPGCTPGVSGGRTEEGVTCEQDTDCCGGLFCKPREVSEVRVVYDDAQGDTRYRPFKLTGDPAVMPNECVRPHNGTLPEPGNGPRFDSPTFKGVPLDFCRSFGINCGGPAADYFCQLHGYGRAVEWSEPRVPATPPCETCAATVIPEQGSACSTAFFPHCDTFKYIVCGN